MVDPSSLYGGYLKASRYSRIKDADLSRALKPYGITLSAIRKNPRAADAALRRQAARAVIARRYPKLVRKPKLTMKPKPPARPSNGGLEEFPTITPAPPRITLRPRRPGTRNTTPTYGGSGPGIRPMGA